MVLFLYGSVWNYYCDFCTFYSNKYDCRLEKIVGKGKI